MKSSMGSWSTPRGNTCLSSQLQIEHARGYEGHLAMIRVRWVYADQVKFEKYVKFTYRNCLT